MNRDPNEKQKRREKQEQFSVEERSGIAVSIKHLCLDALGNLSLPQRLGKVDNAVEMKPQIMALEQKICKVSFLDSGLVLDLIVTVYAGGDWARVRLANNHTNIVLVEKNGEVLQEKLVEAGSSIGGISPEKQLLTIRNIVAFARAVDLDDVRDVLERQIAYNTAICEEGLRGDYGGNVGKVILREFGSGVMARCKAKAAAGSDARMGGCELPVVINSGSGNQGITVSGYLIRD